MKAKRKPKKIPKTRICEECDAEGPTKLNKVYDIRLCEECQTLEEYKTIYKTLAKEKFFLTDKDIADCDHVYIKRGGGYHDICLYKYTDIVGIFCTKYQVNPFDEAEIRYRRSEIADVKSVAKAKRELNAEAKQTARKKELVKELRKYKLTLRPDSKLCEAYINGKSKKWTKKEIAQRMCQMRYLYDYCEMDWYVRKVRAQVTEARREGYGEFVSPEEQFEMAEQRALEKHGPKGSYPKKWPWMAESDTESEASTDSD